VSRRSRGLVAAALLLCSYPAAAQSRPDSLSEYRAGNFEAAILAAMRELQANDRNMDSYVALSRSLMELGRHEEALRHAGIARTINRHDPRMIDAIGEIYFFLGNNSEALRYLQHYANVAPEGNRIHMVYFYIGEIFIREGMFRHADIALTVAVHKWPGDARWWARLAFAREMAGDFIHAVPAYERAIALDSLLDDARRGLDRVRVALARM